MTVSRAIATAGGLAKEADGKRATILRREGGDTRAMDVDLALAKTDSQKDTVLKAFDILDVASRGGGRRKLPPQREAVGSQSHRSQPPLRVVD